MSIVPEKWQITWGEKEIPVTAEMIVHALDMAISTVHKELANNRVIRSDARMKTDWEQGILILELARRQFEVLDQMEQSRMVRMKIPGDKVN